MEEKQLDSGNWVSKKLVLGTGFSAAAAVALSFLVFINIAAGIVFMVPALVLIIVFIYFLYARYLFSPKGKDIQNRLYSLILDYIDFTGKGTVLDIGCGDGSLIIKLADKYPEAEFTGIDLWEGMWGYSKERCEGNVKSSGVNNSVSFIKASASELPFEDESFDLAVSNFVFHEVKDAKDKKEVIKEALRVVKKGGVFVFNDLFLLKSYYGDINSLLGEIKSWGIRDVEYIKTADLPFVPKALKLPFMTGAMGIIKGEKQNKP